MTVLHSSRGRPGVTMVELLLFLGLFGVVASVFLPLLFSATESRLRVQTIALVEHSGMQVSQLLARTIRQAERVLDPPLGATGTVLSLRFGDATKDPTLFTEESGSVLLIQGWAEQYVSSNQVGIYDFTVRNTSESATRQSVSVSFRVSRTTRLPDPQSYSRLFETVVALFPDDDLHGNACNCAVPHCSQGKYAWQLCDAGVCRDVLRILACE